MRTLELVRPVKAGDKLGMPGHSGQVIVNDACAATPGGRWYCVTHRKGFANQLEYSIHIDAGRHRVAWLCFEHGAEVP
jgi:hypothetical protein